MSTMSPFLTAALDELTAAAALQQQQKSARAAAPPASPYAGQREAIRARQQAARDAQLQQQHALARQHQAQAAIAGHHTLAVEIHRQQAFGAPPDAVLCAVQRRFGDQAAVLVAIAMGAELR